MTKGREWLSCQPKIIPARVSIHHLQLRDLLQPAAVKNRVLFVNRLNLDQVDFATLKPPVSYCTLDFQPNCLTTACGLLAAGGQHGELVLRPLYSPPSTASSSSSSSSTANLHADQERQPAPWRLRTPTGGSINNAINIQPDLSHLPCSYSSYNSHHPSSFSSSSSSFASSKPLETYSSYHPVTHPSTTIWTRDQPSSYRPPLYHDNIPNHHHYDGDDINNNHNNYGDHHQDEQDASQHLRTLNRRLRSSLSQLRVCSSQALSDADGSDLPNLSSAIKVLVSNNDQSIKAYKLRPQGIPSAGRRVESGFPILSRTSTLHFPTAVNHSSLSPDQRTLVAVGDTPDVFIYAATRSGEYENMATYTASTDACFSTSWSPDGSKFAVASQDGIVSVWDVRSSHKLATLTTSQANMSSGSGAARVVKFSPHGDMLAFTEHRNFFHVTDTVTFTDTQTIAVPTVSNMDSLGSSSNSNDTANHIVHTTASAGNHVYWRTGNERIVANDGRSWSRPIFSRDQQVSPTSSATISTTTTTATSSTAAGGGDSNDFTPFFSDRFRIITASPPSMTRSTERDLLFRERERRSIMHDNFMREWTRAINQVGGSGGVTSNSLLSGRSTAPIASLQDFDSILSSDSDVAYLRSIIQNPSTITTLRPESSSINISGMCWDPDGEFIYCSTEKLIARYNVSDPRQSSCSFDFI